MNRINETENILNNRKNIRWKLSMTNMLLEINTDPNTGKTLSIKMINDDDDDNLNCAHNAHHNQEEEDIIKSDDNLIVAASVQTCHETTP